jgi:hypothetical protein
LMASEIDRLQKDIQRREVKWNWVYALPQKKKKKKLTRLY